MKRALFRGLLGHVCEVCGGNKPEIRIVASSGDVNPYAESSKLSAVSHYIHTECGNAKIENPNEDQSKVQRLYRAYRASPEDPIKAALTLMTL